MERVTARLIEELDAIMELAEAKDTKVEVLVESGSPSAKLIDERGKMVVGICDAMLASISTIKGGFDSLESEVKRMRDVWSPSERMVKNEEKPAGISKPVVGIVEAKPKPVEIPNVIEMAGPMAAPSDIAVDADDIPLAPIDKDQED